MKGKKNKRKTMCHHLLAEFLILIPASLRFFLARELKLEAVFFSKKQIRIYFEDIVEC